MKDIYKAHINEKTGAVQTVKEHCENTGGYAGILPCRS